MDRLSQDRDYCAQILRDSGSTFFAGFVVLPKAQREALMALYAFCRQIDDIADRGSDPSVAASKLLWWQQEIARVFDQSPGGEPAQHPIGRCLREDARCFALDRRYFSAILEGVQSDLRWTVCLNREQLLQYCYKVSCCVGLLSIAIFGYQRKEIEQYATWLGYAMQLTNIIRDVRHDAERGRVYLPQDELRACGVETGSILNARQTPDDLRAYLRRLGRETQQMYHDAFSILKISEYRQQLAGIVMGNCYLKLLREMERDGYHVMEYRIALPPHRKFLALVETWLRAYLGIGFKNQYPGP